VYSRDRRTGVTADVSAACAAAGFTIAQLSSAEGRAVLVTLTGDKQSNRLGGYLLRVELPTSCEVRRWGIQPGRPAWTIARYGARCLYFGVGRKGCLIQSALDEDIKIHAAYHVSLCKEKRQKRTCTAAAKSDWTSMTLADGELQSTLSRRDALEAYAKLRGLASTYIPGDAWATRDTVDGGIKHRTPAPHRLGTFKLGQRAGQKFSDFFHWSDRLKTPKPRQCSAPEVLRKVRSGALQVPEGEHVLTYVRHNSAAFSVNQFPTWIAKDMVSMLGARAVLDPCAGWGDRLGGFMSAGCVRSITLIEPRRSACQAYKDEHAAAASTTQLTLIPGCAEVELARLEADTFDLIMTSPPYYNTELYLQSPGDGEQAHSKFKSLEDFKTGFLAVLLQESARLLRPEGVLALNIDNSAEAPRLCEFVLDQAPKYGLHAAGTLGIRKRCGTCEPIYLLTQSDNLQRVRGIFAPTAVPALPVPVVRTHGEYLVVRDDLLPGGTKRRGLMAYVQQHSEYTEFVYASPCEGYAQLGLAHACHDLGRQATVFVPERSTRGLHTLSQQAERLGAKIIQVRHGRQSNLKFRAEEYCRATKGAHLVAFGCDHPVVIAAIKEAALSVPLKKAPTEVWCVASSGVLTRSLQAAWPHVKHYAVEIGHAPTREQLGEATVFKSTYEFSQDCPEAERPGFESSVTYDAKAWSILQERASPGALFWNVGK
jgi:tRNA1(Val) A37 N6-methylase TrmN6